jgi:hypothetical protein
MSATPFFSTVANGPSNAPSPTDTEVISLQKINALLSIIAQNAGRFNINGEIQVYDSVNSVWRTLTAPNGVLTVT